MCTLSSFCLKACGFSFATVKTKFSCHPVIAIFKILPSSRLFILRLPRPHIGRGEGRAEPNAEQKKKKKVKAAEVTILFRRLRKALKFWCLIPVTKIVMRTGNGTPWIHCPDNDLMRMGNGESITNSHYEPKVVISWFCSDASKWRMSDISWESAKKHMEIVTCVALKWWQNVFLDGGVWPGRGRRGMQSLGFVCWMTKQESI